MTDAQQLSRPRQVLSQDNLADLLFELSDYIGVHEVESDEFGIIRDAKLVWWNNAYGNIRTKPVVQGQSMMESYYEPQSALFHVAEAWTTGQSHQVFRLSPAMRDRYRVLGERVVNLVNWTRIGDHVVEVGTDVRELMELRERLMDQSSLITKSVRQRDLAIERERIACSLHDHVIQNLYAISLVLAKAGKEADEAAGSAIRNAVGDIEHVITGIRSEIFDLERRKPSQLRTKVTDCLSSILEVAGCSLDLRIADLNLDAAIVSHLCAVCAEASSNAVRHGMAANVWIDISREGRDLVVSIADDGIGFDPSTPRNNGLNNMRQRAISLGGTMQIELRDGGGTVVVWTVPHPGWLS